MELALMSMAAEQSTARSPAPELAPVETHARGLAATPAAKRALIIGYLTYRGDARVKRQVRTLTAAGYAVDVICLAEDAGEITGPVNLIGIQVAHYRGRSKLSYILC